MSYDPTLGRWIEMDPETYIDGPNMYPMERSNPVDHVDPMGLFASLPGLGHDQATLNGLQGRAPQSVINLIANADKGQDGGFGRPTIAGFPGTPDSYPFSDPTNHGDNSLFGDTFDFMNWRWENIRNVARAGICLTCEDLRTALEDFGKILHAIQDLYSHSTYIEMWNERMNGFAELNAENTIPLWPMGPGINYIPDGVISGNYPGPAPRHADVSKDAPDSPAGMVTNGNGISMYNLALDAATRATTQACDQLENMIPDLQSRISKCNECGAFDQSNELLK
jgi:hypothetical protein